MTQNQTNGTIGVTTENIFPIIKKFLYSDHEIFLRELVSNAVDATTKVQALARMGETKSELGDLTINISIDEAAKTLTISDKGVGMTKDEVEKYINQIAFSGAGEFMEKYKDQNIIGHFGLGFYSAFMVADKVEFKSLSHQEGATAVHWSCDGSPTFSLGKCEKAERGTEITLHISDDSSEFGAKAKIEELLKKYCSFLPVPISFGNKEEWKDGKMEDTGELNVINDTTPLWTKKPADIKPEEYDNFYKELYPMSDEPLFNIHLNVDYPFELTGILYFPKLKNNIELQKNKIQLYCNQVFVTDSIEGIVPEFLTLLHGVIDSPDIPLNVSRSYLQSDSNVKKISSHITKKVSDRLSDLFKSSRDEYEKKWDDLKLFIQYGTVSNEKFSERMEEFTLLKSSDSKYYSISEYAEMIKENQTDKSDKIVHIYSSDPVGQFSYIEAAKAKGYDVLIMDSPLESHFISILERKNENWTFVRVDSNVVEKLIEKDIDQTMALSADQQSIISGAMQGVLPVESGVNYSVEFAAMNQADSPVVITQNEFMRRMKDMSKVGGGGMSFYGEMPESYTVVVNGNHPLIVQTLSEVEKASGSELQTVSENIVKTEGELKTIEQLIGSKKADEISAEEKEQKDAISDKLSGLSTQKTDLLKQAGIKNTTIGQLIDLAMLSSGLLKGEKLQNFIKRSVEMIKK